MFAPAFATGCSCVTVARCGSSQPCLIDRHAGFQTRDHVAGVAHVARFPVQRTNEHPQWRRPMMREALRQDADNRVRVVVKQDLFADDVWIAGEVSVARSRN